MKTSDHFSFLRWKFRAGHQISFAWEYQAVSQYFSVKLSIPFANFRWVFSCWKFKAIMSVFNENFRFLLGFQFAKKMLKRKNEKVILSIFHVLIFFKFSIRAHFAKLKIENWTPFLTFSTPFLFWFLIFSVRIFRLQSDGFYWQKSDTVFSVKLLFFSGLTSCSLFSISYSFASLTVAKVGDFSLWNSFTLLFVCSHISICVILQCFSFQIIVEFQTSQWKPKVILFVV